jgi:hypothetical protein
MQLKLHCGWSEELMDFNTLMLSGSYFLIEEWIYLCWIGDTMEWTFWEDRKLRWCFW